MGGPDKGEFWGAWLGLLLVAYLLWMVFPHPVGVSSAIALGIGLLHGAAASVYLLLRRTGRRMPMVRVVLLLTPIPVAVASIFSQVVAEGLGIYGLGWLATGLIGYGFTGGARD